MLRIRAWAKSSRYMTLARLHSSLWSQNSYCHPYFTEGEINIPRSYRACPRKNPFSDSMMWPQLLSTPQESQADTLYAALQEWPLSPPLVCSDPKTIPILWPPRTWIREFSLSWESLRRTNLASWLCTFASEAHKGLMWLWALGL